MRARLLSSVLLLGVLLLAGCVPQQVDDPIEPAPSATPIFESEDEALAAAVAAYEAYLKVSDEIMQDGGGEPERIEKVAGDPFLSVLLEGYQQMRDMGWISTGSTQMRGEELQSVGGNIVTLYVCEDVSQIDVQDSTGESVVDQNRPESTLFLATIEYGQNTSLLTTREVWSAEPC